MRVSPKIPKEFEVTVARTFATFLTASYVDLSLLWRQEFLPWRSPQRNDHQPWEIETLTVTIGGSPGRGGLGSLEELPAEIKRAEV